MKKFQLLALMVLTPSAGFSQSFEVETMGREILTVESGFNYLGLRFHESLVASSNTAVVTPQSSTIGVDQAVVDELVTGTAYLFEVVSGNATGGVIPILSFDQAASTITLSQDFSSDFQNGDAFSIRPSATLASVFGENNESGMGTSAAASAADRIWLPDGVGGFDKYYFYNANFSGPVNKWYSVDPLQEVDPHQVLIYYPDGIIIQGNTTVNSFAVAGAIKTTPTTFVVGAGFQYLSSIYPAGGTIASLFGPDNESGLLPGFGGPSGDQIFYPDPLISGEFQKYYYDDFNPNTFEPAWMDAISGTVIVPESVSFNPKSGFVFLNGGSIKSITVDPPAFYSSL